MHITSLPSPYGIGSMGKAAYDFIDFLKEAKQTYWQILPINPPGYGDSPYQAFSTFAGNPYLIDLDALVKDGYLLQEELDRIDWGSRADQVDFSKMYDQRLRVLHLAWSRFHKAPTEDYAEYVREQSAWLDEYVLFMAVKAYYNDGPWTEWPLDIRMHQSEAMAHYRELLQDELDFHRFLQYCFHTQWQRLREYAHENGVLIIGDIPIYVPLDSADVWSHPENFQLTRTRRPRVVAAARLTASTPMDSIGAIPSMTGRTWNRTASPGGCDACAQQGRVSMLSASTISAGLKATGPFLLSTARPARANGSRVPA